MIGAETINRIAEIWGLFMASRSLNIAVVFLIAAALWSLLRKKTSAQFGYFLFLIVLLKPFVPSQQTVAVSIPQLPALERFIISPSAEPSIEGENLSKEIPLQERKNANSIQESKTNVAVNESQISNPVFVDEIIESRKTESSAAAYTPSNRSNQKSVTPREPLSIWAYFFFAWGAMTLYLLVRFIRVEWRTYRSIRNAETVDPSGWPVNVRDLAASSGVRRPIRFAAAPWVRSPIVYGFVIPTLLVPTDFADRFSERQIRWILLHELAHVRRWDTAVKFLQKIVQYLFFFHPAVWIANGMMDRLREFACDDDAVLRSNISHHDCGESYLRVVFQSNHVQIPAPGLLGLNNSKRIVKERLMRILDRNRIRYFKLPHPMLLLLAAMAWGLLALSVSAPAITSNAEPQAVVSTVESADASTSVVSAVGDRTAKVDASASVKSYPTKGYTIVETNDGRKQYVWTSDVDIKAQKLNAAKLLTQDGDISVHPHPDPSSGLISAQAKIVIQPNNRNITVSEEEILEFKKSVDVELYVNQDEGIFKYYSVIPEKRPKGISAYVDIVVHAPVRIAVEAESEDGDLVVKGMRDSVWVKSEDGDIVLHDCPGPIRAQTEDGDVVIKQAEKQVNAVTEDGDIVVTFAAGPADDCSFQSSDGSVNVSLSAHSKLNLELKCGDGEIEFDRTDFEGEFKKSRVRGTILGGGPILRIKTDDGDINLSRK